VVLVVRVSLKSSIIVAMLLKNMRHLYSLLYCDIDVERGRSPDVAVNAFKDLINKVKDDFPETQILLLSMKPTLIDDFLRQEGRKNKIITNEK
tara:strand:- start:251 stop:529 length:279 start_codon:yes stop_codon:yes gene_type:complete